MMPGMPPAGSNYPGRRQNEYQYHQYPPQGQSPAAHNPYANYYPPPYHGHPQAQHYAQPWYPQYHHHQQPQYTVPQRQYLPPQPHSPLVVSSHPTYQHVAPVNRQQVQTPPIAHSQTPPVAQSFTPQPAPSTPSVASQAVLSPTTPTTSMSASTPPASSSSRPPSSAPFQNPAQIPPQTQPIVQSQAQVVAQSQPPFRLPFYPTLPWYSCAKEEFPPKMPRRRRRRRDQPPADAQLQLPVRDNAEDLEDKGDQTESQASTLGPSSDLPTPATSLAPSENDTAQPITASAALPPAAAKPTPESSHKRNATRPAVPLIPFKPRSSSSHSQQKPAVPQDRATEVGKPTTAGPAHPTAAVEATQQEANADKDDTAQESTADTAQPEGKAVTKSWADLVRSKAAAAAAPAAPWANGVPQTNGSTTKSNSLVDVLTSYTVDSEHKRSFLKPRGLVNTGNMCYMNSVLQTLVFCVPFYDFLDRVGKQSAHSFKSETPLLDAMIMFMREYPSIDAATSAEQLQMRLKPEELEQYGDAFIPEYVYEVIKRLPRFSSMRRGHQQDAEEFLGFLLAGLHDDCVHVIESAPPASRRGSVTDVTSPTQSTASTTDGNGWHEVGPKQRAAITRSSGHIETESPVTKVFGGKLRSVFRVVGQKDSVTLEPYQPLQLDIGAPQVSNISDALKGLTRSETIQGDFNPARGPNISGTKQVFIETLPPVLILHLKRFQYDSATGLTRKIWKKVGYPLELEIPKEVFPPNKRSSVAMQGGLPKYKLIAVIYHHGKYAGGGHYTADIRRQDGREWIRMDDTIIRRVRPEDVAAGGAEEDPKILAKALEAHEKQAKATANGVNPSSNIWEQLEDGEEDVKSEDGKWSHVNGTANKKFSAALTNGSTGTATPVSKGQRTPNDKSGLKDNMVAYILFYEQIKN